MLKLYVPIIAYINVETVPQTQYNSGYDQVNFKSETLSTFTQEQLPQACFQLIKRLYELDHCQYSVDNDVGDYSEDEDEYQHFMSLTGPEAIQNRIIKNELFEDYCKDVTNYEKAIESIDKFLIYHCYNHAIWEADKKTFKATILEIDNPDSDDESNE